MTRYVHSDVLDGGLNAVKNNATKMLLIGAYSTGDSYATVVSNKLAEVAMTSSDFTITSSGDNRVLTTAVKATTATATNLAPDLHVAFTDGSSKVLWVADDVTPVSIVSGSTISFPAITYVRRQPGPLGESGLDGSTILSTSGSPSNMIGKNGDYALDISAQLLYGPKSGDVWPSGVSIRGAQGPQGTNAIELQTINNATGAVTLDCTKNVFNITQTGNATYSFSNIPAAAVITIIIHRTGAYTDTWPASVVWQDNITPAPSSVAGLTDVYSMLTVDTGTMFIAAPFAQGVS